MKKIERTIFTGGENYTALPEAKKTGPRNDNRQSYEDAKKNIIKNINNIKASVNEISKDFLMDEIVINMKMRTDRSSKSDHPYKFLRDCNLNQVGTKRWYKEVVTERKGKEKKETKIGKDIYISVKMEYLNKLLDKIENDELLEPNKDTLRSIEEMYIDRHENMLKSFASSWEKGRIEIVLHPIKGMQLEIINKFKEIVSKYNGDYNSIKVREYEDGPIFISMLVDKSTLIKIKDFNVIRSIQPLEFRSFGDLLDEENLEIEVKKHDIKLSENTFVPNVKLGIFDGGVSSNHYIFDKYVEEHNLTESEKEIRDLNHGNAVISMALFGDLKNLKEGEPLPVPTVKVESFRVLPLEDKSDSVDLYEIIDHIERVAKDRPDIRVFNLSLGPEGPIEDDLISRFTYSLDRLAMDDKRIFIIAVGNSGNKPDGIGRIQAPADSVNNIAVGSYTYNNDKIVRANYSCYGDGREGAKIKPDVVEYGGDDENRLHFLSSEEGVKLYASGTSFASPVVARKIAEILGYTSIKRILTAKALLIHTAISEKNKPDKYFGNGVVLNSYEDMLECSNNKITVTFESELLKAKRSIINLPFISNMEFDGKVSVKWTLCVSTSINPNESDDYTDVCIEDVFVPNIHKHKYTHPITRKHKTLDKIEDADEVKKLLDVGWTESKSPVTRSTTNYNYKTEQERRKDFKWDTVINRFSGKMNYKDIKNPIIELHAMSRDREGIDIDRVKYSLVVTIEYINCQEDVYKKTQGKYNLLNQAKIENINEIIIQN